MVHSNAPLFPQDRDDFLTVLDQVRPIECVASSFAESSDHHKYGDSYRDKLLLHTIHGGDAIPSSYYDSLNSMYGSEEISRNKILASHNEEKDWGANQVAAKLAEHLGLAGFWRVNVARALMDFGRFPGITVPGADHMQRYAINYPFSYSLDHDHKKEVLENYYDAISNTYESLVPGKLLQLAIHTYDSRNPTSNYMEQGTLRPEISVIFRPMSVQQNKKMVSGIFDPLYPSSLAEFTADRKLTARISLNLEKAGLSVSHNFPYNLPEGSVEVRTQIWIFFKFLRDEFESHYPETREMRSYVFVWQMMLDTNLRSSGSEGLRSYLHMFRRAPIGFEENFANAQKAYVHVQQFFNEHKDHLVPKFRFSPRRLGTLGIEVRKDLVWKFTDKQDRDPVYGPDGAKWDNINAIAKLLAEAIHTYFMEDRKPTDGFWGLKPSH